VNGQSRDEKAFTDAGVPLRVAIKAKQFRMHPDDKTCTLYKIHGSADVQLRRLSR
jgi:hypothetical protein